MFALFPHLSAVRRQGFAHYVQEAYNEVINDNGYIVQVQTIDKQ